MALGWWLSSDRAGPTAQDPDSGQGQPTASATSSAGPKLMPTAPRGELLPAEVRTIETFRKASPSVVYITKLAMRTDRFRRDVFAIPQGSGSGFVWDDRGHVVTNYHVIAGGQAAQVTLANRSVYSAKLVGSAPDKDLAVLHIDAPTADLHPLPVGTSNDLAVGQHVLAIGNPFGLDHTLSTGVISGLGREIKSLSDRPIQGVIQTDAAINPGNSGGPLLDSSGRLIGINTAIYSPSGASAGIGFAVPVDTVNRIVTQLIEFGRVVRPGLGVQIAEESLAKRIGLDGVLVLGVLDGSPAEQAQLRPTRRNGRTGAIILGDVIVGIDGVRVRSPDDLYRLLDTKRVGQAVKVTLLRGDQQVDVELTLAPVAD
ncbi:MAG: trypsin-like peptidase domain-containing protein [Deltaproteobacteria bacterium]|jgi:S1-C subfamily serine protease|nr:trypsin-like peptidase domain-containing protein [Deltaproteobacteria bacterium]MBW2536784.1 trypsin-like peptidase domain-containing protein [Deltaproteobacteria bacterium]